MATLLTLVEAKSKTVSHKRLLEILNNEHVQIRKAFSCEDIGKFFRIVITSDMRLSSDPYFDTYIGLHFLGQGVKFTDGGGSVYLLHQWSFYKTDLEINHGPVKKLVALVKLQNHINDFAAWIETSRGW